MNVDLTRAIARNMDLHVEIRLGPWADMVDALETGEIDALQGIFYSEDRARLFDFTPPHLSAHYVSVVHRGKRPPPRSLDELKGLRVAVQRRDAIHDHLARKGMDDGLLLLDDQEEVLRAVAEGHADCALTIRVTAVMLARLHGWTHLEMDRRPFLSLDYGFAVRAGNHALLAELAEGLRLVEDSGEYHRIRNEWLGIYEEDEFLVRMRPYIFRVAAPLLILLLAALAWTRLLRRTVARRTRELTESQERFRALFEQMLDGLILCAIEREPDGHPQDARILLANPAFHRITNSTDRTIEGQWLRAACPQIKAQHVEAFAGVVETGEPLRATVYADEFSKHLELVVFRTAKDRFAIIVVDATERIAAERQIKHLNKVLRAIRDVNQLIVRETDPARLIQASSRIMVEHRGYISAIIAVTGDDSRVAHWAAAGFAGETAPMMEQLDRGEWPACCRMARERTNCLIIKDRKGIRDDCPMRAASIGATSLCTPLIHEGIDFGCLIVAVEGQDAVNEKERSLLDEIAGDIAYALHTIDHIRKRDDLEKQRIALIDQLAQAQKMEAVGRLAGGVAHDFNNVLMGIMGNVELASYELEAEHPIREFLDEIRRNAERSADLTRQLLAFARKQMIAPKVLDLNEAISNMLKLLRRLLGEDIALAWMPGNRVPPVLIDPSQLDQILANLCVNARDAMAKGGKMTIETGHAAIDTLYCEMHAEAVPGDYVMLVVSDNGTGISAEVIAHIFEPFFTTKKQGQGTGLGLATVYGIVKQNHGFINVYSEPDKGTTFKIYLPCATGSEVPVSQAAMPPAPPVQGTGTILLVEDEAAVRKILERQLGKLGYQVIVAANANEAQQRFQEHQTDIDLLLTDVVLPGLSGRDLAEKLRKERPGLRVLYMSGYTANVIAHHGVLDPGVEFLAKPITIADLSKKLHGMLSG